MKSNLILFDGISGSGKGSRIKTATEYLTNEFGLEVTTFVEPSHLRDEIKRYRNNPNRDPREELELFIRDRKLGLEDYVDILGKEGHVVIGDRSFISTLVYQSLQGISIDEIKERHSFYPTPDLAFILLCDPAIAVQRIQNRNATKGIEISLDETTEKITKLRDRYLEVAETLSYAQVINANGRQEANDLVIRSHLNNYLEKPMNKAVFLDKDGTIVNNTNYPEGIPTDKIFQESYESLKAVQSQGYKLFIISSQPWVAQGRMTRDEVKSVFDSVVEQYKRKGITIDGYAYCEHNRKDNCPDKKPSTRLIENIIREYNIDTRISYMLGDMDTDMEAGKNMGLITVRIENELPDKAHPYHKIKDISELGVVIKS